jgi:hypothetical protein
LASLSLSFFFCFELRSFRPLPITFLTYPVLIYWAAVRWVCSKSAEIFSMSVDLPTRWRPPQDSEIYGPRQFWRHCSIAKLDIRIFAL